MKSVTSILAMAIAALWLPAATAAGHSHSPAKPQAPVCQEADVRCAKTVTSAFDGNGKLWRLWTQAERLYYSTSSDGGRHFGAPILVDIAPEPISSRGENRPKIAFDRANGVYLSWASPLAQKYTANIRFSYSLDGGNAWQPAQTVNNDGLLTGHSFNEMTVSAGGEVSLVWLDKRDAVTAKQQSRPYNGSAIYLAQGRGQGGPVAFSNEKLVDGTCVCCRLGIDVDITGQLAVTWRHIFGDNIRDHAIMTMGQKAPLYRTSHDLWHINGCPHQGPSLSISEGNRYHMTWFNNGERGKGVFYAFSDDGGEHQSTPQGMGDWRKQASHPHVLSKGLLVDVIWLEFDGEQHQLWHRRSQDGGNSFSDAALMGQSRQQPDRPFLISDQQRHYISWQQPGVGHQVIAL